jgi:hypothetical protein
VATTSPPVESPTAAAAADSPTPKAAPNVPGAAGILPSHPQVARSTAGCDHGTEDSVGVSDAACGERAGLAGVIERSGAGRAMRRAAAGVAGKDSTVREGGRPPYRVG